MSFCAFLAGVTPTKHAVPFADRPACQPWGKGKPRENLKSTLLRFAPKAASRSDAVFAFLWLQVSDGSIGTQTCAKPNGVFISQTEQ